MVTITFTAATGGVSIDGQVVYDSYFADDRFNQTTQRTADGALVTYDVAGKNIVNGEIVIKNVTYADGELLRLWIMNKAIYMQNSFTITTPVGIDLGEGKGVNISSANYMKKDMKGVLKYRIPGIYLVTFPYSFVRT